MIKWLVRIFMLSLLILASFDVFYLKNLDANETVNKSDEKCSQKNDELNQRELELKFLEQTLKEKEKNIDAKIEQLKNLREAITGEILKQKKESEEKVVKLVTVFETMSPKSVASVLETMDEFLAVEVMKRMEVSKLSKIMNKMDKAKSAKLSELLTGYGKPKELDSVISKYIKQDSKLEQNRLPAGQSSGQSSGLNTKKP